MGLSFFYVFWCPARFPYHMMFVLFNIKTTGVTTEPLIIRGHLSSTTVFCSLQVAQSLFYGEVPHWVLFVIVVPFILTIVLSVLIGLTASDYPFGIFNVFYTNPWS